MFQKYTEKARRTIFFGRFEASQLGSPYIESEHLLLGLLREYKGLTQRFLKNAGATELIRKQIEDTAAAGKKPPISTSVDLPLSNECKRVLAYAAEEAERFSHQHIGCEHLLVGLLREEKSLAAEILRRCGLSESVVREELARSTGASFSPALEHAGETKSSLEFGPDLVAQASNDQQPPLVGRETELEQLIRILGRFKKNNPVLLGEPGVGYRRGAGAAHCPG
jgi:ATP-dependent Clp protease ATP-binding subunit ClpC